ncbi:MAG: hypothetical protein AMQ22_00217 [Candidatus Methanofastidiosum methylothiophilum]|uniref:Double zinc ribbon n=1 Tax=Candidatus Methanofastidiosum methylothiophilum TaxID=1705564 RepID=A0A150IS35_9EURY|nr:MAG: hypothetical protein APG11_00826 [Candidatus Methanofastidiosum methylthiophilus]KYC53546.1 MAG: hypothetical protein AMQ22_00217 [Candidatus Methanofastidiosum methylthiophilus]
MTRKCVKCKMELANLTPFGLCPNCLKKIESEGICLNCQKRKTKTGSPFCRYCHNLWLKATMGFHENKFRKKDYYNRVDKCTECHETKPIFASKGQICVDCSEKLKIENFGWCAGCHSRLVFNSPYCKDCLRRIEAKYVGDICIECGVNPIFIKKYRLCTKCYQKKIAEKAYVRFDKSDISIGKFVIEAKKLRAARRVLNLLLMDDNLTPKVRLKMQKLFEVEKIAYGYLEKLFPNTEMGRENFEQVLMALEFDERIDWDKLFKIFFLQVINEKQPVMKIRKKCQICLN